MSGADEKVDDDAGPGNRLGGFELTGKLGKGGMGTVYRGKQVSLSGRPVAVKVLSPEFAGEAELLERFRREAGAAARLTHPNVVQVHEYGSERKYHFIAMELCSGGSLAERIAARKRLDEVESLQITVQVARALVYAEKNGIVHRDVKPANILFSDLDVAKLADLGLARDRLAPRSDTITGTVIGTPHYMSPEQALGERDIDGRTDTYALGVTLYHSLTGTAPFSDSNPLVILNRQIHEAVPDPRLLAPAVSERTAGLVARMTAKDRAGRHPRAADLVADLEAILASLGVASGRAASIPASEAETLPPRSPASEAETLPLRTPPRRKNPSRAIPVTAAAIGAAVLGLATAFGPRWSVGGERSEDPPPRPVSASVRAQPAGDVLTTAATHSPPAAPPGAPRARLGVGVYALGPGGRYQSVESGDALASHTDRYIIGVVPQTQGHLYVFQVDAAGHHFWLFPKVDLNPYEHASGDNPVTPGKPVRLPPDGEGYELDDTTGTEHIYVVLSTTRWPELEAALASTRAPSATAAPNPFSGHVEEPNDLNRGIAKAHRADPAAVGLPADFLHGGMPASLPIQLIEGSGSFLLLERSFRHVKAKAP